MLWTILFAIVVVAAFISHASQRRTREAVANLPGPCNLPLLGALHRIIAFNPHNILEKGPALIAEFGKVIHLWLLNRSVIISADLQLNEQLLTSPRHTVKHRNYKLLRQWLGVGLLLNDGPKWFARRKIITPTFHFRILEQFVEVFDQQSTVLLQRLSATADGRTAFDVYPYICLAALDIIAETSMGTKVGAQTDASSDYATAVNRMTKLMSWRFLKPHLNNEIIFTILYPHLKLQQMRLIKTMHNFTINVIEGRRRTLKHMMQTQSGQDQAAYSDNELSGTKKRMALLDVLLQSTIDGKPLSNEDIREEVDTFMFEGHDTTTSALSFGLHLIARHPAVQQRMHEEICQVIGTDERRALTLHDLNELKYVECVIKETLRMYPPVPIIGREIDEDLKYKHSIYGDGIIPAGSEYLIFIYGMMRNAELFVNPDLFQPERHKNNESMGAFSMIPFSAGPRNCIGQKFAMFEMKTILARVIREYELLPFGEGVKMEMNIVLRSSNGCQLGMRRRQSSRDKN